MSSISIIIVLFDSENKSNIRGRIRSSNIRQVYTTALLADRLPADHGSAQRTHRAWRAAGFGDTGRFLDQRNAQRPPIPSPSRHQPRRSTRVLSSILEYCLLSIESGFTKVLFKNPSLFLRQF